MPVGEVGLGDPPVEAAQRAKIEVTVQKIDIAAAVMSFHDPDHIRNKTAKMYPVLRRKVGDHVGACAIFCFRS